MTKKYDELFFKFLTMARDDNKRYGDKMVESEVIEHAIEMTDHFIKKSGLTITKTINERAGLTGDDLYSFIKTERPLGISKTALSRHYRHEDHNHLKTLLSNLLHDGRIAKLALESTGGRRAVLFYINNKKE